MTAATKPKRPRGRPCFGRERMTGRLTVLMPVEMEDTIVEIPDYTAWVRDVLGRALVARRRRNAKRARNNPTR